MSILTVPRTLFLALAALALAAAVNAGPQPKVNVDRDGLAVKSHDVVAPTR